jgi:hypothetical protein
MVRASSVALFLFDLFSQVFHVLLMLYFL